MRRREEVAVLSLSSHVDMVSLSDLIESLEQVRSEHGERFEDLLLEVDEVRDLWGSTDQVLRVMGVS